MPFYVTHGQLIRGWKRLKDTDIDDSYFARERATSDIDDFLAAVVNTPFNAWLRILTLDGNNLTLSLEDVGFLAVGDTIGFYNNSTKKPGTTTTTVTVISGTTVTVADASGMSADDEIAVISTYTYRGQSVTVIGPPKAIQSRAHAIARYYLAADVLELDDPPSTVSDPYVAAIEWLKERATGVGEIEGATYRGSSMATRMEYTPAIDVDRPENWNEDEDLVTEIENERQ